MNPNTNSDLNLRFAHGTDLIRLEHTIIALAGKFGLILKPASPAIMTHLVTLDISKLSSISANLNLLKSSFQNCISENIDPWDDTEFFRLSMRTFGVIYPSDFVSTLDPDTLIEGYDANRFQIFRNMRFMETSSYSLLEIQSYEWPMLFDRSSRITDSIIEYSDEVLWINNRTISLDIPEHYIKEVRTERPQILQVKFKHMCPLYSGPGKPYGALVTCKARVVDTIAADSNLAFV